jgi:acyl carrier protein
VTPTIDVDIAISVITRVLRDSRRTARNVGPSTRVESLGLESLEVVEIFIALEELSGCVVSLEDLRLVEVIADLAHVPCLEI